MTHRLHDGHDTSCIVLPWPTTAGLTLSSASQRGHIRRASARAKASLMLLASVAEYVAGVSWCSSVVCLPGLFHLKVAGEQPLRDPRN